MDRKRILMKIPCPRDQAFPSGFICSQKIKPMIYPQEETRGYDDKQGDPDIKIIIFSHAEIIA